MKDWLSDATRVYEWETARKILAYTSQIIEEVPESRDNIEWFKQPLLQMEADKLTEEIVKIICQMSGRMGDSWSDFEKEICERLIEKNQWDKIEILLHHVKDKIDSVILSGDEQKQVEAIIEGKLIAELCLATSNNTDASVIVDLLENMRYSKNKCEKLSYQILNHYLRHTRKQIFQNIWYKGSNEQAKELFAKYLVHLTVQVKHNSEELNKDFFLKNKNIPNNIDVQNLQFAAQWLFHLEKIDINIGGMIPDINHWNWVYPILSKYQNESKRKEFFKLLWPTVLTNEEKIAYLNELENANDQYVIALLVCEENIYKEIQRIYEQRYIEEINKIPIFDDKAWEQIAYVCRKVKKLGFKEEFHRAIEVVIQRRCLLEITGMPYTEDYTWNIINSYNKKLFDLNIDQGYRLLVRDTIRSNLVDVQIVARRLHPNNIKALEEFITNQEEDTTLSEILRLIGIFKKTDLALVQDVSTEVCIQNTLTEIRELSKVQEINDIVSLSQNWMKSERTNQITDESLYRDRIWYWIKEFYKQNNYVSPIRWRIAYAIVFFCIERKITIGLMKKLTLSNQNSLENHISGYKEQGIAVTIDDYLCAITTLLEQQKKDGWNDRHIEVLIMEIYRMLLENINKTNPSRLKQQLKDNPVIAENCRKILIYIEQRGFDGWNELKPGIMEVINRLDLLQIILASKIRDTLYPEYGFQSKIQKKWGEVISAGDSETLGIKKDGSVIYTGYKNLALDTLLGRSVIVSVSCNFYQRVALKDNGTVVAVGLTRKNPEFEGWTDIVAVSTSGFRTVGLKTNGTVVGVGGSLHDKCRVKKWTDIVAISAGSFHTVGLKSNGTVVAVGENYGGQCKVKKWRDIVAVSAGSSHTVGLKSDGTVVAVGLGTKGRCNVGEWTDIVAVSAGDEHTAGLKSDGTVVAVGNNKDNQCEVKEWTDIVAVSAGGYHTVGLKSDGTVVAVGKNEYGQCDVKDWTDIVVPSDKKHRERKQVKK
jgi:hypothetical protein